MRLMVLLTAIVGTSVIFACDGETTPPADPDAPPPKPMTLSLDDLEVLTPQEYPVEDGRTITVTLTNFCDQQSDIGFSPDGEKPPIVWRIQPMQRQAITIPRGYMLRARLSHDDAWTGVDCVANNGQHLTFNVDCASCTVGASDPLDREGCVAAGACLADPTESPE